MQCCFDPAAVDSTSAVPRLTGESLKPLLVALSPKLIDLLAASPQGAAAFTSPVTDTPTLQWAFPAPTPPR